MWKQAVLVPIVWLCADLVLIPVEEIYAREVEQWIAQWEDLYWGESSMVSDHLDSEVDVLGG